MMLMKVSFTSVQICAFDSISKKIYISFGVFTTGRAFGAACFMGYLNGKECLVFTKRKVLVRPSVFLAKIAKKGIKNWCKQSIICRLIDCESTSNETLRVKSVHNFQADLS